MLVMTVSLVIVLLLVIISYLHKQRCRIKMDNDVGKTLFCYERILEI